MMKKVRQVLCQLFRRGKCLADTATTATAADGDGDEGRTDQRSTAAPPAAADARHPESTSGLPMADDLRDIIRASVADGVQILKQAPDTCRAAMQTHLPQLEQLDQQSLHLVAAVGASAAILLVAVIISVCRWIASKLRDRRRLRSFGKYSMPPVLRESKATILRALANVDDVCPFMTEAAEKHGPIFQLDLPGFSKPSSSSSTFSKVIVVGDTKAAQAILRDPKTVKNLDAYQAMANLSAGSLNMCSSNGPHWKTSRSALTASFQHNSMKRLQKVCKECTERWIKERLDKFAQDGKQSIDLSQEMVYLTFSILCRAMFEYPVQAKEANLIIPELGTATSAFGLEADVFRGQSEISLRDSWFDPKLRRAHEAVQVINKFAHHVLNEYRNKKNHVGTTPGSQSWAPLRRDSPTQKRNLKNAESVIQYISENDDYEDDQHRISDIAMIILSGLESTSHSLSWIIYEIVNNDSELQKMRKALNSHDVALAHEMLKDIVREGMRLHPINNMIGSRIAGKDFFLDDTSLVIPEGSTVVFPTALFTRFNMKDADKFQPSRWQTTKDDDAPQHYLLFSLGSHSCAGQSIALAEIAWVLSRVCSQYNFQITRDDTQKGATMKCVGVHMKVQNIGQEAGSRFTSNPQGGSFE